MDLLSIAEDASFLNQAGDFGYEIENEKGSLQYHHQHSRRFEYRGSSGTVSVCVVRASDYRMESVRNDLLLSAANRLGVSVLDEWGGT